MSAPVGSRPLAEPRTGAVDSQAGGDTAEFRTDASPRPRTVGHAGAVVAALALWGLALPRVDLERINDYGLVTALPLLFYVALAVLTVSFCVAVAHRRSPVALLALHAVALVTIVHATLPLLYDAPRYAYLYKHLGVVEYIAQNWSVDTTIDIYHNWPGFFWVAAGFAKLTGLTGTTAWAAWSQPVFGLVCVAVLPWVLGALSADRRLVWTAVWVFLCANWIGQDYFSPQAFTYLLYLLVIGVCFRWLRGGPVGRLPALRVPGLRRVWAAGTGVYRRVVNASLAGVDRPWVPPSAPRRAAAGALLLALYAVVVVSHQLTPFTVLAGVVALVAVGWVRPWYLPLLMLALVAAWAWRTYPFVTAELGAVASGDAVDSVTTSLADLDDVSAGRATVAWFSRALTGSVALLAALGVWRRLRAGRWDLPVVLLAAAPGLLLVEPYGGEILMRVFFYALPWLSFLAAGCFFPTLAAPGSRSRSWLKPAALLVASGVLLSGLLFAYFGLEKANRVREGEVAAARWFYGHAEPGALLMLVAPNFPTRLTANYHEFPGFDYDVSLLQSPRLDGLDGDDVPSVIAELEGWRTYAYLMFSSSQVGWAELLGVSEPGALRGLEQAVTSSGRFEVVYANEDARLLRLLSPLEAAERAARGTGGTG